MQESKSQAKRRVSEREQRRIATVKQKHGADFYHRNSKKAGKLSPTKFNSDSGSAAAKARWDKHRENREKGDK
jgi:hypothetical protein